MTTETEQKQKKEYLTVTAKTYHLKSGRALLMVDFATHENVSDLQGEDSVSLLRGDIAQLREEIERAKNEVIYAINRAAVGVIFSCVIVMVAIILK